MKERTKEYDEGMKKAEGRIKDDENGKITIKRKKDKGNGRINRMRTDENDKEIEDNRKEVEWIENKKTNMWRRMRKKKGEGNIGTRIKVRTKQGRSTMKKKKEQ